MLRARPRRASRRRSSRASGSPSAAGFAGRIAAERRPIFIPDVDHADILNPILREKGIRSLLGVPLLVEGRVIGVLHVGSLTPREFTPTTPTCSSSPPTAPRSRSSTPSCTSSGASPRRSSGRCCRRSSSAIAGLEVAAPLPARAQGASLGGDWYDVFPLAGGRVGVAVGDVVGHGLAAAALMAQLRTALRAYAFDGHPPAAGRRARQPRSSPTSARRR